MLYDISPTDRKIAKPAWFKSTAKYAQPSRRKSLWQLFNTLVPYFALWAAMLYTVELEYPYWMTLALALLGGGILVRVFILFHDCCHGSFFASRRANTILGYIAGVLTFMAFEDWRHAHNLHHATAGDLDRRGTGDIWTMTLAEYLSAPRGKRRAYSLYRNPLVFIGLGSLFYFLVLQRFAKKNAGMGERRSVFYTNVALLCIIAVASLTVGLQTYLLVQLPIIAIAGALGLWLFYVQHQFENVYWVRHDPWDPMRVALEGSSYFRLPKILQWFTGNIGLHHVHHVRPNIPNYNLQRCHDEIPVFHTVIAITLRTSLHSLNLGLCDEQNRKLVSFRSITATNAAR
jgi:omega-6 fatty acid desaturase (delta-12 desaturase)